MGKGEEGGKEREREREGKQCSIWKNRSRGTPV